MARRQGVSHPEDSKNFGKIPQGKSRLFCNGSVKHVVASGKLSIIHTCQNIGEDRISGDLESLAVSIVEGWVKPKVSFLIEDFDVIPVASKIITSRYEETLGNIWHVLIPFEGDPFYLNLHDENELEQTVWFESQSMIGIEILDPTGEDFDVKLKQFVDHVTSFCDGSHKIILDARDELISLAVDELNKRISFIERSSQQTEKFAKEGRLLTKNRKVPRTFEKPMKKKLVKPVKTLPGPSGQSSSKGETSPALRDIDFKFINEILWGMGLALERCSNAVRALDEESLRDILKAPLNLHYSAVTGEAFNHTGKTDILVNDADGTILYIAECKKYDGPEVIEDAITQLFKNLVWRDRRCSLIIFNTSRKINTAIDGVREAVEQHPLFVKIIDELSDNKSQYTCTMNLSKDESIEAIMQVQIFDLSSEG